MLSVGIESSSSVKKKGWVYIFIYFNLVHKQS